MRIRLPQREALRWLTLPAAARGPAIAVTLGTRTAKVDLAQVVEAASELQQTRLVLTGLGQLAQANGFAAEADRIMATVDRIDVILGER
jgi:hypothetical protein